MAHPERVGTKLRLDEQGVIAMFGAAGPVGIEAGLHGLLYVLGHKSRHVFGPVWPGRHPPAAVLQGRVEGTDRALPPASRPFEVAPNALGGDTQRLLGRHCSTLTARPHVPPEIRHDVAVTPLDALAIAAAGAVAGAVNTIVGSGSLVTFPTLLALGYPAVVANVSNTVGLVPGSVSGAIGYRRELAGQRSRLLRLGAMSLAGGVTGALLLLAAPRAFRAVVPFLILLACALMAVQPRLARRGERVGRPVLSAPGLVPALVFLTGVYGGYFGAAQGVLLIALLSLGISDELQRLNATKNVLAAVVNGVAAIVFIAITHVDWAAAGLIAVGAVAGAFAGAALGRRIPDRGLRYVVVLGGTAVAAVLLVT